MKVGIDKLEARREVRLLLLRGGGADKEGEYKRGCIDHRFLSFCLCFFFFLLRTAYWREK